MLSLLSAAFGFSIFCVGLELFGYGVRLDCGEHPFINVWKPLFHIDGTKGGAVHPAVVGFASVKRGVFAVFVEGILERQTGRGQFGKLGFNGDFILICAGSGVFTDQVG